MSAQIFQFPIKPRRVPVGDHFTVEASETVKLDVRQVFAELATSDAPAAAWLRWIDNLPEWLIGPVHVCDEGDGR